MYLVKLWRVYILFNVQRQCLWCSPNVSCSETMKIGNGREYAETFNVFRAGTEYEKRKKDQKHTLAGSVLEGRLGPLGCWTISNV